MRNWSEWIIIVILDAQACVWELAGILWGQNTSHASALWGHCTVVHVGRGEQFNRVLCWCPHRWLAIVLTGLPRSNISFPMSLLWPIYIINPVDIKPNCLVILPDWHSTTVFYISVREYNPCKWMKWLKLNPSPRVLQWNVFLVSPNWHLCKQIKKKHLWTCSETFAHSVYEASEKGTL